ncbi:MAG: hypothetical protein ACRDDY_03395 [Clostridium sp.]|uniref:hypothetical protein n=1 Tax=Clostridium sp. TaxID=1506 RepID=UPI003EE55EBD
MMLKDSTKEQIYEYINKLHDEHRALRHNVFDLLPNYKDLDEYICKTIYINEFVRDEVKQKHVWESRAIGFIAYYMSDSELLIKRIYVEPNYRKKNHAKDAICNLIEESDNYLENLYFHAKTYTFYGFKLFESFGLKVDSIDKNGAIYMERC